LNSLAPTYYEAAPEDNTSYPVIVYYVTSTQPLYFADNTFSDSSTIFFTVDVYGEADIDDLVASVKAALKSNKAVLRSESDNSGDGLFGSRLSFEIYEL
jgi:hypothetical protein